MVKLAIIQPANGTFAIFRNTPEVLTSDPLVIGYLDEAWRVYNRSATVTVNDNRVFINQTAGGSYTFSNWADQSDARPMLLFLQNVDDGVVPDPGNGGNPPHTGGPPPTYNGKPLRLLLLNSSGLVDSGATYAQCSQTNQDGCQPVQFATLEDGVRYAYAHNEYPYRVYSTNEAWAIVANDVAFDPTKIIPPIPDGGTLPPESSNTTMYLIAGAAAILLLMNSK